MTQPLPSRIQIIGSGAIGSLMAANAQRNGIPYSLCPRDPARLTQRLITYSGQSILLSGNMPVADQLGARDILVLPVKVHQLAQAAKQWQTRLSPQTPVLLIHNGMGGFEAVRRELPKQSLYLATTSHGAIKINHHEVKHTGFGRTVLGEAPDNRDSHSGQSELVLETLSRCLQPVTWQQDIMKGLWLKLAVNAVINPLTAIHNVKNGELEKANFKGQISDICHETAAVAQACGMDLPPALLEENVQQVIGKTAANYSSMHQDIWHHRVTEIAAINGYILQQAEKKGIDVPVNTFLYNKVKSMESRYS